MPSHTGSVSAIKKTVCPSYVPLIIEISQVQLVIDPLSCAIQGTSIGSDAVQAFVSSFLSSLQLKELRVSIMAANEINFIIQH